MDYLCGFIAIVVTSVIQNPVLGAEYGECSRGMTDFAPGMVQGFFAGLNATDCELAQNIRFPQYDPSNLEDFDFIIVGAGASGCLLANKLSANPNWRILLLEAGGDPILSTEVPGFAFFNMGSDNDWKYTTASEDGIYWGKPPGGTNYWPRGLGVGGSTLLNAMFYTRGTPADYEAWLSAKNDGWGYQDLLPHFKELETMRAQEVLSCSSCMKYHGTDGGLSAESFTNSQLDPYSQTIVNGLKELGLGLYPDFNNPEMIKKGGFYFIQGSKKNARRCNAAKAFLTPIQDRLNLRISKHSLATKIIIDKSKMEATGVEFKNRFGQKITVLAKKEVIVSGGSINTPQLMMLSGIGPERLLKPLGIDVIKHVPFVGANLQDHVSINGIPISLETQFPGSDKILPDQLFEYYTRGTGPMTMLGDVISSNGMFINTGSPQSANGYPDVEILAAQYDKNSSIAQNFGSYTPDIQKLFTDVNSNKATLLFRLVLLRPKSRGRVFLKTKNPEDHPKLYAGYFRDQSDFYPMIAAIRFIERLLKTKPMRDIGAKLELLDFPRCRKFKAGSDDYWACFMRHLASTTFHPSCTMKMGPDSDPSAVVDSRLRVKGFRKLRVVDLSVSPSLVSAHTQLTAYVIAHKGAEMIIEDNGNRDRSDL